MPERTRWILGSVALAALVLVLVIGLSRPTHTAAVSTDRLGPSQGNQVQDYLAAARASLTGTGQRWALLTFAAEVPVESALRPAAGLRVSEVLFRVPIDRVQTPVTTVEVSADPESVRRSPSVAADDVQTRAGGSERDLRVAEVVASRLRSDCACVLALLVRADVSALQSVSRTPGVRAVEALPADAVFGRFAVQPLLPEQTDTVRPGPDDGAVPAG